MTGHQPGLWHCGILAKSLAAHAVATPSNAAPLPALVHIVVDHDESDPGALPYPAADSTAPPLAPDSTATTPTAALIEHTLRLAPQPAPGVPAACCPPVPAAALPPATPLGAVAPFVRDGLARARDAFARHDTQPSLALQAAHAAHDLLAHILTDLHPPLHPPLHSTAPWRIIPATDLALTPAFADALARMVDDPRACALAYNRAVALHPEAGLRPLAITPNADAIELPLWRITPGHWGSPRVPAKASDVRAALATASDHNRRIPLAPRALLMTALLRAFCADLFIHGTGGGLYDRATTTWLTLWLNPPTTSPDSPPPTSSREPLALPDNHPWALCPAVVASATVRLPLLNNPPPSDAHLARARWLAHAAQHNPALLRDDHAAAIKRAHLATIRALRHAPPSQRLAAYRAMHADLDRARLAHAPDLAALLHTVDTIVQRRQTAGLALRRTWSFALMPDDAIHALSRDIHHAFAHQAQPSTPAPPGGTS
jgi:hypothetical protein